MDNKKIIGVVIFIILIAVISGYKIIGDSLKETETSSPGTTVRPENIKGLTTIYVATGGGKEDFLADEEVNKILREEYKLNVVYDSWSNGKTVSVPLIREYVKAGNKDIANRMANGETFTINSPEVSTYDALFTSDQRYYDYYKNSPDKSKNEAERYRVQGGGLTLNTPIVIYSWAEVVETLEKENIVTKGEDEVYYITDMPKLMQYILDAKKWKEIGLDFGDFKYVNIDSTDPVTSSPGLTYYGLLLSILCEGQVTEHSAANQLPSLANFYEKSGYMNNTPADLFERYLRTGPATEPMIVDYEKSMIDFANTQPEEFEKVKDNIRILYPSPTIWNSHCFAYFTENGKKLYDAYNDPTIQQIAWSKYGFRTGTVGGSYDVSALELGIPKDIRSTVSGLKMNIYDVTQKYLGTKGKEEKQALIDELIKE